MFGYNPAAHGDHEYNNAYHFYDEQGRIILDINWLGYVRAYEYHMPHSMTFVSYANRINLADLHFEDNIHVTAEAVINMLNPDPEHDRREHFIFDANGRVAYNADAEMRVISTVYDQMDRVVQQVRGRILGHQQLAGLLRGENPDLTPVNLDNLSTIRTISYTYTM